MEQPFIYEKDYCRFLSARERVSNRWLKKSRAIFRDKDENGVKSDGDEDTSLRSNGAHGSGGSAEDSDLSDEDFSEDDVEDQLREYSVEMAGLTQEISIKVRTLLAHGIMSQSPDGW